MRKKILAFLTTILFACANLQAAPTHEGAANNAQPVVLYGKTSGGALKAFRTDSDGNLQTSGGGTTLTTKGDLQTYDTAPVALAVGANGQCLLADSTQSTGLKWGSCAAGAVLTFATDASTTGHVTYVGCSDNIQTAINAASDGDTLILGSCDYSIGTGLTSNKSIRLIGQGTEKTSLTASSGLTIFTATHDDVSLSNMTFNCSANSCSAVNFNGASITLKNGNLKNINVNSTSTASSNTAIQYIDAGGLIQNAVIVQSCSGMTSTDQCKPIYKLTNSSSTVDTVLNIIDVKYDTSSQGTSNTLMHGVMNYGNSAANASVMNIINGVFLSSPQDATTPTNGIECESQVGVIPQITTNVYNSYIDGGALASASGGTQLDVRYENCNMNIYNTVLRNNTIKNTGSGSTATTAGILTASGIRGSALSVSPSTTTSSGSSGYPVLSLTGQDGGSTTIATTGTGGAGGGVAVVGGNGGSANSANTASTGGAGGYFSWTGGNGGSASTATGTNTGGAGGYYEFVGGTGGNAASGTSNTGGDGGYFYATGGTAGTGATANGVAGNVVLARTSGGTIRGAVCFKCKNPDTGDDIGIDGAQISTTQRIMGVTRETNSSNVGHHFLIHAGGSASGSTDKGGGSLILESGVTTGTGRSFVKTKTPVIGSSGTSDNSYVTKEVSGGTVALTNGVNGTLAVFTNTANSMLGGTVFYTVVCSDGTNYQSVSGMATYAMVDKGGVLTKVVTENASNQTTAASSGTLTTAWAISAGKALLFSATSSLTPTTLRVYYKILNHSDVDYTAASPF